MMRDADFTNNLRTAFTEYLNQLRRGAGENGEGFNVARIVDPFSTRPVGGGASVPITNDARFLMNDIQKVKTSWNRPNDASLRTASRNGAQPQGPLVGRNGYSVKFVAFKTLLKKAGVSPDSAVPGRTWTNDVPRDAQGAQDLQPDGPLQH
jgi:hypothetical protein